MWNWIKEYLFEIIIGVLLFIVAVLLIWLVILIIKGDVGGGIDIVQWNANPANPASPLYHFKNMGA